VFFRSFFDHPHLFIKADNRGGQGLEKGVFPYPKIHRNRKPRRVTVYTYCSKMFHKNVKDSDFYYIRTLNGGDFAENLCEHMTV
jgi:hypothetical protein